MAKKHRSSLAASSRPTGNAVRERRHPSVEFETDATEIRDIVSRFAIPAGFDRFKLDFGEDSTGTPAVWVRFIVEDDPQPSKKQVEAATQLAQAVTGELLKQEYRWWPYVSFVADS